jgi:hypothetical protein
VMRACVRACVRVCVCECVCAPVVTSLQTAGEGDEPLNWLYQTPADGAAETEQISQVCSSAGVRDFYTTLGATLRSCIESVIGSLLRLTYSTYPRILSCSFPPWYGEQRRKDVQQQLETLNEQLRSQIESIVDMCEECIQEAEEALIHNENAPRPDDDKASSDASKVFHHGMHARAHAISYTKCVRYAYESPTYTHTHVHTHGAM